MIDAIRETLNGWITGPTQSVMVSAIMLAMIAVAAVMAYYLTELVLRLVEKFVRHSPTSWDDDLLTPRFMRVASQLAPAIVVALLLPRCFGDTKVAIHWLDVLTSFYIIWAAVRIGLIFLDNLFVAFSQRENLRYYAIKGVFQMFKLIVISIGVIIGLSLLIGKTPIAILTTLGASAAVLSLVFKDTILGLVASVQLSANNMLHKGDWIVVPEHNANGEVIEVSLSTVKVRNWDNTVTTVPPYSLISGSFQNYEAMRNSGGRRVDRSVFIDVNSVRFCTPHELADLKERGWLDGVEITNLEHTVNLQIFRHYLRHYLSTHPEVNKNMTIMVRQLAPTPSGLPLQLYFFTDTTVWVEYERIQADIFDHLYAAINLFGLNIFQSPSGRDFQK